ncbi:MAG: trypsin-like peptidase domain-containing protein [Thermoplasmatales archaeon]|nr:MAG: trypsin-like peptidase domain-containing protein [Thermoplasmatales archaeon]
MFRRILVALIVFMLAVGLLQTKTKIKGQATAYDEVRKIKRMIDASVLICGDYGYGAGVFIADNIIATAAHLLDQPGFIIELSDGTELKSNDFYIDDKEDVGFIFVEADELYISNVTPISGNVGDTVYLVGAPYFTDLKFTITKGILSHLDRDVYEREDLLQTDAEGALGSSGGPLYNDRGEVIGICVAGPNNGGGVTLCESGKSVLEALERALNSRGKQKCQ